MTRKEYNDIILFMHDKRCDSYPCKADIDPPWNQLITFNVVLDSTVDELYFQANVLNPNYGKDDSEEYRNVYYISLESPKYMVDPPAELRLSKEEKEFLNELVHRKQDFFTYAINVGCCTPKCKHCIEKPMPEVLPDYRLLPD